MATRINDQNRPHDEGDQPIQSVEPDHTPIALGVGLNKRLVDRKGVITVESLQRALSAKIDEKALVDTINYCMTNGKPADQLRAVEIACKLLGIQDPDNQIQVHLHPHEMNAQFKRNVGSISHLLGNARHLKPGGTDNDDRTDGLGRNGTQPGTETQAEAEETASEEVETDSDGGSDTSGGDSFHGNVF